MLFDFNDPETNLTAFEPLNESNTSLLLNTSLPETCYWIGFILADGHISPGGKNTSRLEFSQNFVDGTINQVQKFRDYLAVSNGSDKSLGNGKTKARMSVQDSCIRALAQKYNINSNNKKNAPDFNIESYDQLFDSSSTLYPFLIGFIDGDGYIRAIGGRTALGDDPSLYSDMSSFGGNIEITLHKSWLVFLIKIMNALNGTSYKNIHIIDLDASISDLDGDSSTSDASGQLFNLNDMAYKDSSGNYRQIRAKRNVDTSARLYTITGKFRSYPRLVLSNKVGKDLQLCGSTCLANVWNWDGKWKYLNAKKYSGMPIIQSTNESFDFNDSESRAKEEVAADIAETKKYYETYGCSKEEVEAWCQSAEVAGNISEGKWKVTPKGIDASAVSFSGEPIGKIKYKFNEVDDFVCTVCHLKTLENAPNKVNDLFSCSVNQLESLEGGPKGYVKKYYVSFNDLKDLYGAPERVGIFIADDNKLKNFEGSLQRVTFLSLEHNLIDSFKGIPIVTETLSVRYNRIPKDEVPDKRKFRGKADRAHQQTKVDESLDFDESKAKAEDEASEEVKIFKTYKASKKEVEDWIKMMYRRSRFMFITPGLWNNVTITLEGIDVHGTVDLSYMGLDKIPFKFGKVDGDFICSANDLYSLDNCPRSVGLSFYCDNNILRDLVGMPSEIGRSTVVANNPLETLKGIPKKLNGSLCVGNTHLTDFLKDGPDEVNGKIDAPQNHFKTVSKPWLIKDCFCNCDLKSLPVIKSKN